MFQNAVKVAVERAGTQNVGYPGEATNCDCYEIHTLHFVAIINTKLIYFFQCSQIISRQKRFTYIDVLSQFLVECDKPPESMAVLK